MDALWISASKHNMNKSWTIWKLMCLGYVVKQWSNNGTVAIRQLIGYGHIPVLPSCKAFNQSTV